MRLENAVTQERRLYGLPDTDPGLPTPSPREGPREAVGHDTRYTSPDNHNATAFEQRDYTEVRDEDCWVI